VCDGEAAVIKQYITSTYSSGTTILKTLHQLVDLCTAKLGTVQSDTKQLHSVTKRKFFAVGSKCAHSHQFRVPNFLYAD
jgi:hypothetical protein